MKRVHFFGIAVTLLINSMEARPSGEQVVHGQVVLERCGSVLQITASDRSIIEWKNFSIDAGEGVRFIQPDAASAVLNRVMGGFVSQLHGDLNANGQVFLINPNGIVMGEGCRINAGSFTASTFDVLDQAFLDRAELAFFGDSEASIINLGKIEGTDVFLIARNIEHRGVIEAQEGEVGLCSGAAVALKPAGSHGFFILTQEKFQEGADPYSHAFSHPKEDALDVRDGVLKISGKIEASSINLVSESIALEESALINASCFSGGGEVVIGIKEFSKTVDIDPSVVIRADALDAGDGGKVVIWSESATRFPAFVSAQGGPNGGDGGFIEVSSRGILNYTGLANTLAPLGKTGTLLLDPSDFTIGAPDANLSFAANTYTATAATANLSVATLQAQLALTNVTVNTNSAFGSAGNILVSSPFTWASANDLAFIANGAITVAAGADIVATGAGANIAFQSGNGMAINANIQNTEGVTGGSVALLATSGDIILTGSALAATDVIVGNQIGPVTVQACSGSVIINPATGAASFVGIGSTRTGVASAYSGNVTVEAGQDILITAGTVADAAAFIGHGGDVGSSVTRNITATAGRDITVTGGLSNPATRATALIGFDYQNLSVRDRIGDITVNAGRDLTLTAGDQFQSRANIGCDAIQGSLLRIRIQLNVGGNLLVQGPPATAGVIAYIGIGIPLAQYANDSACPIRIFVAGNTYFDGRRAIAAIIPSYSVAQVAGYNPELLLHCQGNITFMGNAQIATDNINPIVPEFTTDVWAGGRIRCLNGVAEAVLGGQFQFPATLVNYSIRAAGDVITGGNAVQGGNVNVYVGTGTYAGYSPAAFSGLFIEADSCFPAGQMWPPQTATVCGSNVFSSSSLGGNSPNISCDGVGAFSPDSRIYTLAGLPTPYNGQDVLLPITFALFGNTYSTSPAGGNIIIHSADVYQGENFCAAFAPGTPAVLTLDSTTTILNGVNLLANTGNIEISGSDGPSLSGCPCINSYENIVVTSLPAVWTDGSIYMSANNNVLVQDSVVTGGANSPVTIISDHDVSGAGDILLTSNVQAVNGTITLTAGQGNVGTSSIIQTTGSVSTTGGPIVSTAAFDIQVGGTPAAFSTSTGPISFDAGHDVIVTSSIQSTTGSIFSNADNSTFVTGTTITTAGPITMISGVDMQMTASLISSTGSNVDLVVDNLFPVSPLIGPGVFIMDAASTLNSDVGYIRVYTALQSLNSIDPGATFIQGGAPHFFTAGTLYIDSTNERWCTYYPFGVGGVPFTIYYKDCLEEVTPVANLVVSEMLTALNIPDEFLDWPEGIRDMWRFMILYDEKAQNAVFSSFDYLPKEYYWIPRMKIRLIHQPAVNRFWHKL